MTSPTPPGSRPPRTDGPPAAGQPASPSPTSSLVKQILEEQKQQKAELNEAIRRPTKGGARRLAPVAAAVLIIANVLAWVVFPPRKDTTGTLRSPAQVEKDLRLTIASAAAEVEIWRQGHAGQLPPSLGALGVADSGLVLVNVDGTVYEVRGEDRGIHLAYRSNVPLTEFMDAVTPGRR